MSRSLLLHLLHYIPRNLPSLSYTPSVSTEVVLVLGTPPLHPLELSVSTPGAMVDLPHNARIWMGYRASSVVLTNMGTVNVVVTDMQVGGFGDLRFKGSLLLPAAKGFFKRMIHGGGRVVLKGICKQRWVVIKLRIC